MVVVPARRAGNRFLLFLRLLKFFKFGLKNKKPCRGNQGPGLTGSNGNAGPINGEGLPIDPAAETYKKQVGQVVLR